MKRLIIFLLLLAAIEVAGQTTGYLRFDTVLIYKQGGTAELILRSSTKDTTGVLVNYGDGRTRFMKSRALNDSTIVVGLDTIVIRGATGGTGGTFIGEVVGGYGLINVNDSTLRADTASPNGLVTRTELLDSLNKITITRKPITTSAGSDNSVPDTLSLILGYGVTINAGDSALRVDTFSISTRAWRQKGIDSLSGVIRDVIDDTAAAIRSTIPGSQNLQSVLTVGSTLNQNNTVQGAGFRLRYNNGEFNLDSLRISAISSFGTPSDLLAFGDSYPEGYNFGIRDTSFVYRVGTRYSLPVTNWAVSARGIWRADSAHNFRVNPGHSITSYIWAGFNDIRRGGINNDTTYRKVIQGLKSIIANQFLKSYVAGGSSGMGVTRHGTWTTTYTAAIVGGKSANNGGYTQTNNDSIVYVFPAPDSTVVIATINGDNHGAGFNMGSFNIFVNGTLHGSFNGLNADGISDGANANDRSPNAFIITGLPYGIHRITLINTSANFLVVDYFGHLVDRSVAMPLLIGHAPYNNVDGFAVSPNKGSVAAMLKLNNQIDSMVAVTAVGWPIFVVETNNFLDTLTGIEPDDIHPNDVGDLQITTATMTALPAVNAVGTDGTLRFNGANFIGAAGGDTKVIPWRDEVLLLADTLDFIKNQSGAEQNAGFRINQASIIRHRLTVGSSLLTDGADQLDIVTSSTSNHMRLLGFSGTNFWQSINSTNQTGVPLSFGAAAINLQQITGGSSTTYATFDNTATNKFVVTGNALFNSTVRLGSSLNATNAPITLGTVSTLPYLSFYRSGSPTDQKIWDKIIANDSVMMYRTVNDAFVNVDTIYYVQRSGLNARRLVIPTATLMVGRWNTSAVGFGARFNRSIGANKDSVNLQTTNGARHMVTIDTVTGKFERMAIPSSSSATLIYQFVSTQQITVSNTTTETTIYGTGQGSAGIDGTANVTTGTQVILKGAGTIDTDGVTAGEVTFAFKFPTSTVSIPVTGLANGLTGSTYTYEFKAIPLGTGTGQDYIWFLEVFVENNGAPVIIKVTGRETGVLTTTGTLTMDVTVDWNTADTDNTLVANFNTVEVVKK